MMEVGDKNTWFTECLRINCLRVSVCYDIKEVTAAVEKVVFFYNTEHLTIDGTSGGCHSYR